MVCPNCGKDNDPNALFCIECGQRLERPEPQPKSSPVPPPQPSYYGPAPQRTEDREPLSMGTFTLMELIARIPLVNFIMFLVWGFGSDVNENKKNWARSRLIWMGITFVLSILGVLVGVGIFSAILGGIAEAF